MTAPLQAFILSQPGLVAYYPLGEASGDALDGSANSNDGTVTLGAGTRAAPALDQGGDGSLLFDGADTKVTVPDHSTIQNIWDGGGSAFFMFNVDSQGEANNGYILSKGADSIAVGDEAGGLVDVQFIYSWSGNAGTWKTDVDVPINATIIGVITYAADAAGNDPIIYLWDGTAFTTRTVGNGLTRTSTPTGTRTPNVSIPFNIGNNFNSSRTVDGHIDELALFDATLPAAKALKMIKLALEGAPAGLVRGGGGSQAPNVGAVTVRTLH